MLEPLKYPPSQNPGMALMVIFSQIHDVTFFTWGNPNKQLKHGLNIVLMVGIVLNDGVGINPYLTRMQAI